MAEDPDEEVSDDDEDDDEEDRQWHQTLREFDALQQRHYSAHPRPGRMTRIEEQARGVFRSRDELIDYMEEVEEEIAGEERQMQERGEESNNEHQSSMPGNSRVQAPTQRDRNAEEREEKQQEEKE